MSLSFVEFRYQGASFRGVPFLVEETTTAGGRKVVQHEFVNSDVRVVEDLGLQPKAFTLDAVFTGIDFIEQRDALTSTLDIAGEGILSHPTRGFLRVTALPYTIGESNRQLGIAKMVLSFVETTPNVFPNVGDAVSPILDFIKAKGITFIKQFITKKFSRTSLNANNSTDAIIKVASVGAAYQVLKTSNAPVTQEEDNLLNEDIKTFEDSAPTLVNNVTLLSDEFAKISERSNTYADGAKNNFTGATTLFDFGESDEPIDQTTESLVERQTNRDVINQSMQCIALIQAYSNVTEIDYADVLEVQEVERVLDIQFEKVFTFEVMDDDVIEEIENLRSEARKFFDSQELTVFKIATVSTHQLPMQLLTFQYYGDTDNFDRLIELNPSQDISYTEGSVDILTL